MLLLQGVTYAHPDKDILFDQLDLVINDQDKIALIGNNGTGKSTLMRIMAGLLQPFSGQLRTGGSLYYVPQLFGQYDELTVAQALRIDIKLNALKKILEGEVTDENLSQLAEDWTIEERYIQALAYWQLSKIDPLQKMGTLSGGQKTKVMLAGIQIHEPDLVLLDEPSNHLDLDGRERLYEFVRTTKRSLLVVSHDRFLLNLLDKVYELYQGRIIVYGGNYDFYKEQKQIGIEALAEELKGQEKALRKAREVERESLERMQKLNARGKKKQEKAGMPKGAINSMRNSAEKTLGKLKDVHLEKVEGISQELEQLRAEQPEVDKMRMNFDDSGLHKGKILFTFSQVNFVYQDRMLWPEPVGLQIRSGERIAIKGPNGSGKTTLIRMLLGEIQPKSGTIERADANIIYIDQDYSLIDNDSSVYEQAYRFNSGGLQEHEIKIRLNRFLFTKESWYRPCLVLSGGERMRLTLCCLTISSRPPDMIILDEPTNNLDIQNIEILTSAINEYRGTLLVVSHDAHFLEQVKVEREIAFTGMFA